MKLGTLCYIRNDTKTLLLHRVKKQDDILQDFWIGLGGKVNIDIGESPHECVIREVKEESGLIIHPALKGIITFRNVEEAKDDWYAYLYTAQEFTGDLIESNEGDLEWIEDEQLVTINIPEGDRIFLQWLLENKPLFNATFVYHDGKLLEHEVVFY